VLAKHDIKISMEGKGGWRDDVFVGRCRRMLAASLRAGSEAPIRFYIVEKSDSTEGLAYKTQSMMFGTLPYECRCGSAVRSVSNAPTFCSIERGNCLC
jgi:hypothetical protein